MQLKFLNGKNVRSGVAVVTAMAVGQRQRLYSGVRMFTGNYLSSTPRELRVPGVYLERRSLKFVTVYLFTSETVMNRKPT